MLAFLTKKNRIERDACIDYYENHHLPLINGQTPPPAVYKRNYLMRDDPFNREDGSIDFDVVTELVFIDRGAFLAWISKVSAPGSAELVATDEAKFLDRSRTRAYVVEEYVMAR